MSNLRKNDYLVFFYFLFFIMILNHKNNYRKYFNDINKYYISIQNEINLHFNNNKLKNKIRIGIYIHKLKGGGIERATSLFLKNINTIKIFDLYLFISDIHEKKQFLVPDNIKKVIIYKRKINI